MIESVRPNLLESAGELYMADGRSPESSVVNNLHGLGQLDSTDIQTCEGIFPDGFQTLGEGYVLNVFTVLIIPEAVTEGAGR